VLILTENLTFSIGNPANIQEVSDGKKWKKDRAFALNMLSSDYGDGLFELVFESKELAYEFIHGISIAVNSEKFQFEKDGKQV